MTTSRSRRPPSREVVAAFPSATCIHLVTVNEGIVMGATALAETRGRAQPGDRRPRRHRSAGRRRSTGRRRWPPTRPAPRPTVRSSPTPCTPRPGASWPSPSATPRPCRLPGCPAHEAAAEVSAGGQAGRLLGCTSLEGMGGRRGSPGTRRSRARAGGRAARRLDALGQGGEAEAVGHGDDRPDDDRVVVAGAEAVDERPVDLEHVERQALEPRQRREAGAEVVDGDADAGGAQLVEAGGRRASGPEAEAGDQR